MPLSAADGINPSYIVQQASDRNRLRLATTAALIAGLKEVGRSDVESGRSAFAWQPHLLSDLSAR